MNTVAKVITNLGAPPFTFILGALIVVSPYSYPMSILVALCGGLFPVLLVALLRARGSITSLDLDTAKDRIVGFCIALGGGVVSYLLMLWLELQRGLDGEFTLVATFLHAHLFATLFMFLITTITMHYDWKASVHSAGASCLMFLAFYFNVVGAFFWAPALLFGISWSRLHLQKHTFAQVVFGIAIGWGVYSSFFSIFA